jgi:hypothetical protein
MASSEDEDEELKRAIAISLAGVQPTPTPPSPQNVVDLVSSDDDDEELRQAIALSLQQSEKVVSSKLVSKSLGTEEPDPSGFPIDPIADQLPPPQSQLQAEATLPLRGSVPPKPPSGLFGLDRKVMEQERLERLRKRKRTPSPERPSKMTMKSSSKTETTDKSHDDSPSDQTPIQYPKGAIKRTWAFKHPRTNDIKIEEVLQTSTLNIAVLSAFQWNDRWLLSKLDPKKTKQIWIMSAKGEDLQQKLLAEATEARIPNLKPHFPPMPGQTVNMHSKLMLLFHPTHLRIAIPTANMINVDWGETEKDPRTGESWQPAVMENSVFLIDLPRRSDGQVGQKKELTPFGRELGRFLEAQEVGRNVTEGLLKFDFAETGQVEFIHAM